MIDDTIEVAQALHTSVDLTDVEAIDRFSGAFFHELRGLSMAIKRLPQARWDLGSMVEMGDAGPIAWDEDVTRPGMHIIHAGIPHHLPGAGGYWHVGDVDEIYMWIPDPADDQLLTSVLIERERKPGDRDLLAWYCRTCWTLLDSLDHETGRHGREWWEAAVPLEAQAVERFNADPARRTCTECGTEHPLAYRLESAPNRRPEEDAVRHLW